MRKSYTLEELRGVHEDTQLDDMFEFLTYLGNEEQREEKRRQRGLWDVNSVDGRLLCMVTMKHEAHKHPDYWKRECLGRSYDMT